MWPGGNHECCSPVVGPGGMSTRPLPSLKESRKDNRIPVSSRLGSAAKRKRLSLNVPVIGCILFRQWVILVFGLPGVCCVLFSAC